MSNRLGQTLEQDSRLELVNISALTGHASALPTPAAPVVGGESASAPLPAASALPKKYRHRLRHG